MKYYPSNIFESLLKYIKQFYIPLSIKFIYLFIVVFATVFFKDNFSDKNFVFYIKTTSLLGIIQTLLRYGATFRIFNLKKKTELKEIQFITIVRACLVSIILIGVLLVVDSEREVIYWVIAIILGIIQVYIYLNYVYLTQHSSYLRSAAFDPIIVQIIFIILLTIHFYEIINFESIIILLCIILLIVLFKVFSNLFKITLSKLFLISNNELWVFLTNILSIFGPLLALYLFTFKNNSEILYDLKIVERTLAIILLLPSILNPYIFRHFKNELEGLNVLFIFMGVIIFLTIISFYSIIHFNFSSEIWFYLLIILIFVTPKGSYYGFKLSLQNHTNYFFFTTLCGLVLQWLIYYWNFTENAIIYGVIVNYIVQYLTPIFFKNKLVKNFKYIQ